MHHKKPTQPWLKTKKFRVPWKTRISQDAEYKKKRRLRQAERNLFKLFRDAGLRKKKFDEQKISN